MEKSVLIPLADGFEEIEAVTVIDVLRRAGARVVTAGLSKRNIHGSHGIHIVADSVIEDELPHDWDMIVLPGDSEGVNNLAQHSPLMEKIKTQLSADRHLAAICAAPGLLVSNDIMGDKSYTMHPAVRHIPHLSGYKNRSTATDGQLITGRSAGAAMDFAFLLVKTLYGPEKVREVNQGILFSGADL